MFSYGFYNSLNGDRKYNAEQFNVLISNLINDGVLDNWGGMLMTECGEGGGLQINVKSGRAWFNDTWSENDAVLPLTLDVSDPLLDRIDIVVLEVNKSLNVRANSIFIVKGAPSLTPSSPTLIDTDEIHQHALASITVRANTTEILPTDITIHVGTESCPFVTGILETASIEQLFAAWGYQFDTWFDDLKDKLSGDVAANLQHEIEELQDGKVNISDKASSTDITQGTSGKWIDAEGLKENGIVPTSIGEVSLTPTKYPLDGRELTIADNQELFNKIRYKYGMAYQELSRVNIFSAGSNANYVLIGDSVILTETSNTDNEGSRIGNIGGGESMKVKWNNSYASVYMSYVLWCFQDRDLLCIITYNNKTSGPSEMYFKNRIFYPTGYMTEIPTGTDYSTNLELPNTFNGWGVVGACRKNDVVKIAYYVYVGESEYLYIVTLTKTSNKWVCSQKHVLLPSKYSYSMLLDGVFYGGSKSTSDVIAYDIFSDQSISFPPEVRFFLEADPTYNKEYSRLVYNGTNNRMVATFEYRRPSNVHALVSDRVDDKLIKMLYKTEDGFKLKRFTVNLSGNNSTNAMMASGFKSSETFTNSTYILNASYDYTQISPYFIDDKLHCFFCGGMKIVGNYSVSSCVIDEDLEEGPIQISPKYNLFAYIPRGSYSPTSTLNTSRFYGPFIGENLEMASTAYRFFFIKYRGITSVDTVVDGGLLLQFVSKENPNFYLLDTTKKGELPTMFYLKD